MHLFYVLIKLLKLNNSVVLSNIEFRDFKSGRYEKFVSLTREKVI